jgi:hypothetical protein
MRHHGFPDERVCYVLARGYRVEMSPFGNYWNYRQFVPKPCWRFEMQCAEG